jgi:thiosulfate reductase cytochrome b subunit
MEATKCFVRNEHTFKYVLNSRSLNRRKTLLLELCAFASRCYVYYYNISNTFRSRHNFYLWIFISEYIYYTFQNHSAILRRRISRTLDDALHLLRDIMVQIIP